MGPGLGKPLVPPGTLSHLCLCRREEERGSGLEGTQGQNWGASNVPTSQATMSGWDQPYGLQPPSRKLKAVGAGPGSKSRLVRGLVGQNHTTLCHYRHHGCYHSCFPCYIISIDQNSMSIACCSLRCLLAWTH